MASIRMHMESDEQPAEPQGKAISACGRLFPASAAYFAAVPGDVSCRSCHRAPQYGRWRAAWLQQLGFASDKEA